MLKGLSKILICGGNNPITIDTCEVISLESSRSTCKNPSNFPAKVRGAIGGLVFEENPIICGGVQNGLLSNKCYSLENNEWVSSVSMNSERGFAASAQVQDGKLLVTGGVSENYLNSTEMLTVEGWESNIPFLPVTIGSHCMVNVNSTTVMFIGGFQNGIKTFYFTFGEESWTEGPELIKNRFGHSCGKIRRYTESQEMSIIVAGGNDGSSRLSSVEILDEGSNEWQTGPELPIRIDNSQMIKDWNGGVILIGGVGNLDTLYQLSHGGLDALWTKMKQKLKTERSEHTAFLVPDNTVECS